MVSLKRFIVNGIVRTLVDYIQQKWMIFIIKQKTLMKKTSQILKEKNIYMDM